MNIQYMRYFTTVAKLENVSKAAELLHISQSSLSKNIASLEAELGTPLFDRAGKKLVLNAAGIRFLDSCQTIINEADEAAREIKLMTTGRTDKIRISAGGINQKMFDCMAAFKRERPETEYDMDCFIDNAELPDINEYDMIIYPDEMKYGKFKGCSFYNEKYYLAVSAANGLSDRISAPTKALDGQNFVFLKYGNDAIEYPYSVCCALAVRMNSNSFVSSRELHRQMIMADIGVGFVPEGSADMYRHGGMIKLLPLMDTRFVRPMKVCFKREKHLSELAGAFKEFVINYFKLSEGE